MHCIFIYGPVASGKLTVATVLHTLSDLPVFHNHYAVDAALALFEFGSPGFIRLRELIWLSAFREAVREDRSFIFTFNPEASVPPAFIDNAVTIVTRGGGSVSFIALTCSDTVIESRLTSSSRTKFRKLKSLEQYRHLRQSGAFTFESLPEPDLTIATDMVTPEEAANRIYELLGSRATRPIVAADSLH
ncbi:MAG: shikimate kinase [Gemmatimonadota bacterium]|nr:shikimate kinase [Gemmatimonadota bacterium]